MPGGHALPYPTGLGPNGNAAAFINNGLIGSHVFPMGSNQRFDQIRQFKAEMNWVESDKLKVTAGYQYVGDHDNAQSHDDFANNQWQAYAGYGPASNNIGTHGAALPQNLFTGSFGTGGFHQRLLGLKQPAAQGAGVQSLFGAELPAGAGQSRDHQHSGLQYRLL